MTAPKAFRLMEVFLMIERRGNLTTMDVVDESHGRIQGSDAGRLLRKLCDAGAVTRSDKQPFVYTFVPGSSPPEYRVTGCGKPKTRRVRTKVNTPVVHKATGEGIMLLDTITANWGNHG